LAACHRPERSGGVQAEQRSRDDVLSLNKAEWNNSVLISRDTAARVARLKEEVGGEIGVSGSGNLIQALLKHDLVDEFQLSVFPVMVGPGKRLFGDVTIPRALRLADTKVSSTGVVIHRYERAGKLEYGSFEVDVAGSSSQLWSSTDAKQEGPREPGDL